jgi:hypothetical protein
MLKTRAWKWFAGSKMRRIATEAVQPQQGYIRICPINFPWSSFSRELGLDGTSKLLRWFIPIYTGAALGEGVFSYKLEIISNSGCALRKVGTVWKIFKYHHTPLNALDRSPLLGFEKCLIITINHIRPGDVSSWFHFGLSKYPSCLSISYTLPCLLASPRALHHLS